MTAPGDSRLVTRVRCVAPIASIAVVVLGLLVIVGWMADKSTPPPRESTAARDWVWLFPKGSSSSWGGRIWVESQPGQGSKFHFTARFPLATGPVPKTSLDGAVFVKDTTAHAMKGDREQCLSAGMDDYVPKPIRSEQLFDALERVLSGRPAAAANADGTGSANGECLNLAAALESAAGDPDLLLVVAQAYLDECPKLMAQIRDVIGRGDAPLLQRAAHTLRSALNTFAAKSASEFAERLE